MEKHHLEYDNSRTFDWAMASIYSKLLVSQRVNLHFPMVFLCFAYDDMAADLVPLEGCDSATWHAAAPVDSSTKYTETPFKMAMEIVGFPIKMAIYSSL